MCIFLTLLPHRSTKEIKKDLRGPDYLKARPFIRLASTAQVSDVSLVNQQINRESLLDNDRRR